MSTIGDADASNKPEAGESASASNVNVLRSSFDDKDTCRLGSDASSYFLGDPDEESVLRRNCEKNGSMENLVNFSLNLSSNRSSRTNEVSDNSQTVAETSVGQQFGSETTTHLKHSASVILEENSLHEIRASASSAAESIYDASQLQLELSELHCENSSNGTAGDIDEFSASEEYALRRKFRRIVLGGVERSIDLDLIEPFRDIVRHGGYMDASCAVITLSLDRLPPRATPNYAQVLENVFFYVMGTLEQIIVESYILVVVNSTLPSTTRSATNHVELPSLGWLRTHHALIDRRLRKSMKLAILVNASFRIRTITTLVSLFVSMKLNQKLRYVRTAEELARLVPLVHVYLPAELRLEENHSRARTNTIDREKPVQERVVASQIARRSSVDGCESSEDRRTTAIF